MKVTEHLIDRLAAAKVTAPSKEHVAIQPITIGRHTRMSLFQHPPAVVEFSGLVLGGRPLLRLGCGIKEVAWPRLRSGVGFRVTLLDRRGRERLLLELSVDPAGNRQQRRWIDQAIDLGRFAGQAVSVRFVTTVADGQDSSYCWAGWSDPHIEFERAPAPISRRRDRHAHLLLITADALRADHLSCYGHPLVQTPHLDQLARDGCLVVHARTQCTATMASYASLFTSQYPSEHGILAEWGQLRPDLISLPEQLAAQGYHTLLAASEAELTIDRHGLPRWFAETIPCLAIPAQSGAITARQFVRWLDQRPSQPFLAWVQLFDAHPPCTAPEPFRSWYYRGDPGDELARYAPEKLALIRGVESGLDLDVALEFLAQGTMPTAFVERLRATAAVLLGRQRSGPDLACHLLALGPDACNGMSRHGFGAWLLPQLQMLQEQGPTAELLQWLHNLKPRLKAIEAELLSWLDGVVDFRYPLHQYMSQASHLDHHVGTLLQALKERGLYEQTMIVFASPHGEALGEDDLVMHHHALLESVLRVPVLVKPAGQPGGFQPGRRLAGVFDLIDLCPTVLEGLAVPSPAGIAGVSRWQHICAGTPIPDHDSISVEIHQCMLALARPPHIFLKALRSYPLTRHWHWQAGDSAVHELCWPMRYDRNLAKERADLASAMEQRLHAWLGQGSAARAADAAA